MIVEVIGAIVAVILQAAGILFLAPLITGFSRTLKARLQTRRGPHILQPYRDLYKLARKSMVIPDTASWLFSATPFVLFATTLLAGLLIPLISAQAPMSMFGGALAVVYLLALGRFFLALGGLDTGSSFGGLGSSREMTISAIAEPALMLAVFTVAIGAGSTNLELTMIHEAMILEYSGPYLGLIEWSAWMKQLVLMTLLVNIFFPYGLSAGWSPLPLLLSVLLFIVKLAALAIAVVLVETTNAKLRLFRVPELLAVAFVLSALALISMFLF